MLIYVIKNVVETLGITEASERVNLLYKNISSTLGITETPQNLNVIIRNIIDTIKLTTLENKVTGFVKVATQFIVSVETALNKIVSDVNVYALEDGSGNYLNEDGLGYYQLTNYS